MAEIDAFNPKRHISGEFARIAASEPVTDFERALHDIENKLERDVSKRRALAAGLIGAMQKQSVRLAEHLAWLLEKEIDALTAYSLYYATIAFHPENWKLAQWRRDVMRATPFALLRNVILDDLLGEGYFDLDSDEDKSLIALLDVTNPDHRASLIEYRWLECEGNGVDVTEVAAMLLPSASFAEKAAAIRIFGVSHDAALKDACVPMLTLLLTSEHHPGLSRMVVDALAQKSESRLDLDLICLLVRVWHENGITAAKVGLGSILYGFEGFHMDEFASIETQDNLLTSALLDAFSPTRLPDGEGAIVAALQTISTDTSQPIAAFSATTALGTIRQDNSDGIRLLLEAARSSDLSAVRAKAIIVLGERPRAILPLLEMLKELAVTPETDPLVRRAAFRVMATGQQSALPVTIEDVIDLYFRYLTQGPFDGSCEALDGLDAGRSASYFVNRLADDFPSISDPAARAAAFRLIEEPFEFGIRQEFAPFWKEVAALILIALDDHRAEGFHHHIFWNMLNGVTLPAAAAQVLATGLNDRLKQPDYSKRTRGMMLDWLEANRDSV